MSHPSELLSAYLDGELSPDEGATLTRHISTCGRCAAEMVDVQRVRAAVRSLPVLEVPVDLVPAAEGHVAPLRRHRGVMAGAVAAVVVLVIAVAAMFTPEPSTVSIDELSSRFGARVSLDPAFGPAKVVLPDYEVVVEE
ncbi:MAG: zf-HC2 domain-containing protein [Actinobacteria bacterium]|nr:zf-HC2 domain-containing protein [Actinomycetota bacterium]